MCIPELNTEGNILYIKRAMFLTAREIVIDRKKGKAKMNPGVLDSEVSAGNHDFKNIYGLVDIEIDIEICVSINIFPAFTTGKV